MTFLCDVSYYNPAVSNKYPWGWLSFRACDGNFIDPKFNENYTWCQVSSVQRDRAVPGRALIARSKVGRKALATRLGTVQPRISGYTVYVVYRPGIDVLGNLKRLIPTPHSKLTVMVDVESWDGQIRGNHSAEINTLVTNIANWLGDQRRVLGYANANDYAAIWPTRPSWLHLIIAAYTNTPPAMLTSNPMCIGWQYTDGETRWPVPTGYPRSSAPFGSCDHNAFPGLTPDQLATELGVGDDVLEEIMSFYTSRADFEAALTAIVQAQVAASQKAVVGEVVGTTYMIRERLYEWFGAVFTGLDMSDTVNHEHHPLLVQPDVGGVFGLLRSILAKK